MPNPFHNIKIPAINSSWRKVIHLWKPMGLWTLAVWAGITFILVPVTSAVMGWQFFRSGELIISNEELLSWIISPMGISYLLLGASLILTGWIIQFAGLFQIVSNYIYAREQRIGNIALFIFSKTPVLFRLCLFIVTAGIIVLLIFLGGLNILYLLFLDTYDINYYLTQTPIEWQLALILSAGWAILWTTITIYLITRTILALPAYLHNQRSIIDSVIYAWKLNQEKSRSVIKSIGIVVGFWILVRAVADVLFFMISSGVISFANHHLESLRIFVLISAVYLAGTVIIDAIITFLGFSHTSSLITKLYYQHIGVTKHPPPARSKFKKLGTISKKLFQPGLLFSFLGVALLGSFTVSGYMINQVPPPNSQSAVKIAAHRAGPQPAPENSLKALDLTLQTDAEFAEIDVRLTQDSVVVVTHDFDLMRTANHPARISETNYQHLRQILANKHSKNQAIPATLATLDEFLDAAKERIKLMIELKESHSFLLKRVANAIYSNEMENEVIVMSLNLNAIRQFQKTAPDITAGFVSTFTLGNISQLPVDFLALNQRTVTSQLVEKAQRQDLQVYAWTVNNPSTMANMMENGVDGIITDNPKLASQVREEIQQLSTAERLLLKFQNFMVLETE